MKLQEVSKRETYAWLLSSEFVTLQKIILEHVKVETKKFLLVKQREDLQPRPGCKYI
jgi:hypothetical protein